MPFRDRRMINVTRETKQRLRALVGTELGASEHQVLQSLLTMAESKPVAEDVSRWTPAHAIRILTNPATDNPS